MRSKTRQRLIKEEYEYEINKLSHEDHEVSENACLFNQPMTDKELINFLDQMMAKSYTEYYYGKYDKEYDTESEFPFLEKLTKI